MLPCQHTFCLECLFLCQNKFDKISLKCPICREPHISTHQDTLEFPPNDLILSIMQKVGLKAEDKPLSNDEMSENCGDSSALVEVEESYENRSLATFKYLKYQYRQILFKQLEKTFNKTSIGMEIIELDKNYSGFKRVLDCTSHFK